MMFIFEPQDLKIIVDNLLLKKEVQRKELIKSEFARFVAQMAHKNPNA